MTVRTVVVGAGGYTGRELAKLLLAHPTAEIVGVFGSGRQSGERRLSDEFSRFRGVLDLPIKPASAEVVAGLAPDAVFLCTPHDASASLAGELLDAGVPLVLDLSGAFRLKDTSLYPSVYGFEHPRPELVDAAVYALVEHARPMITGARLISCPGCYPTASGLALRPLAEGRLIAPNTTPIIDAISGVSGAGRGASVANLFCEVSAQPYKALAHRHQPEIAQHAGTPVHFVPHVVPMDRGLVATVHVELADESNATDVARALNEAYSGEPFVRVLESPALPATGNVTNTNRCDIGFAVSGRHAVVSAAIDNLVKGASGQALQAMNVALGLDETHGLGAA